MPERRQRRVRHRRNGLAAARIREGAQGRGIAMLQQLAGRDLDAGAVRPCRDLKELNGIRAQLEQIRGCTHAFQIQDLPEYRR